MTESKWPDLGKPATQADLARLVKVARSTIHGHHDSGLFAEGGDLGDWLLSYIEKLRTEAAGRTADSDEEMRLAKLREMNVKAQKGELEIAQMEKQLVDRQVVYDELYPALLHMKTTLEAAGGRIATALSAQYGITINQRLLDNEFRTALHVIADYTPAERESGEGRSSEH